MLLLPPRGQTSEVQPPWPPSRTPSLSARALEKRSGQHEHRQPALPIIQRLSGQGRRHPLPANREGWERHIRTLRYSVAIQVQKQGFGPAHFAQLLLLAVLRTTLFPPLHRGPLTPPLPHRYRQV
uniref:Uncharacterized protein n=1 Tax=Molossus molossus TaxID=27622 RepID=A0A7J8ERL3_MOLMO|nr:hypothetical protein HJG59_008740 [Molossus molossus]